MRVAVDARELRSVFVDEAREYVEDLSRELLKLEASPRDGQPIHELFRAVHSLKGMAGTMGYGPLVDLAHAMESFFEAVRDAPERFLYGPEVFDLLFESVAQIERLVGVVAETGSLTEEAEAARPVRLLVERLEKLRQAAVPDRSPACGSASSAPDGARSRPGEGGGQALGFLSAAEWAVVEEAAVGEARLYAVEVGLDPECVFKGPRAYLVLRLLETRGRVVATWPPRDALEAERFEDRFVVALVSAEPADRIEQAVLGISEVRHAVATPVGLDQRPAPPADPAGVRVPPSSAPTPAAPVESTIRVETARLDALVNLVGELVIATNQLQDQRARSATVDEAQVHKLGRVTSDLQGAVMRLRMVPVRLVFTRFPRAVRDLARRFDKRVELVMEGEETELDRHIVDAIGEPLLHLVRNAVDHGIEPPEVRTRLGKPATGRLRLAARHEGNHVVIEVEDDGAGIDLEQIRKKAVESGRLRPDQAASASEEALLSLIFEPGFSTARQVSDVSGRGVGMDAAKKAVESLGGRLAVHTRPGQGTLFEVRLPLTLAIIQGLLMEVHPNLLAVPAETVQSIERVEAGRIETVYGNEVLRYRNRVIPVFSLRRRLGVEAASGPLPSREGLAVVVASGRRQAALLVDRVVGLQDLVIRTMGSYLKTPGVAGAAILGSGQIALVLDTLWLV